MILGEVDWIVDVEFFLSMMECAVEMGGGIRETAGCGGGSRVGGGGFAVVVAGCCEVGGCGLENDIVVGMGEWGLGVSDSEGDSPGSLS